MKKCPDCKCFLPYSKALILFPESIEKDALEVYCFALLQNIKSYYTPNGVHIHFEEEDYKNVFFWDKP